MGRYGRHQKDCLCQRHPQGRGSRTQMPIKSPAARYICRRVSYANALPIRNVKSRTRTTFLTVVTKLNLRDILYPYSRQRDSTHFDAARHSYSTITLLKLKPNAG